MIEYKPEDSRPSGYQRPSWSWISVESPVRYWSEIKNLSLGPPPIVSEDVDLSNHKTVPLGVRELRRKPLNFDCKVTLAGKNPYGEVSSAVLEVQSDCLTARLKYVLESLPLGAKPHHVPLKYEIEIGTFKSHIPDIPLFANYVLAEEGPHRVTDGSLVVLVLINPQVALVLVPAASM